MQTFSSREAQNKWGTVTDLAKREPVMITQYGRESFMIVPAALGRTMLRKQAGERGVSIPREQSLADAAEALTETDINAMVHGLREATSKTPEQPLRRLGMLEFLKQNRLPERTRSEIDAALNADRDAWKA